MLFGESAKCITRCGKVILLVLNRGCLKSQVEAAVVIVQLLCQFGGALVSGDCFFELIALVLSRSSTFKYIDVCESCRSGPDCADSSLSPHLIKFQQCVIGYELVF